MFIFFAGYANIVLQHFRGRRKKMKKVLSILLACIIFASCSVCAFAAPYGDESELNSLRAAFVDGKGPKTNGFAIDYAAYSPVKGENDETKYPLVIMLHGLSEGLSPRSQLKKNNFVYWAREDFQSRFPEGGAFLVAMRSPEERIACWANELIEPLMAAITDFVATHKNVDTTRIYLGGFSMGGKMTIRMAITYPKAFAAIFPICPADSFTDKQISYIKDIPMWLTVSTRDTTAGWYTFSESIWKSYCKQTSFKEDSRLSLLSTVYYPDGTKTVSNHHAWFAVTYDMFAENGGNYPNMKTVNASGASVALTFPDGMISWLSSHSSEYDGSAQTPSGGNSLHELQTVWYLKSIFPWILSIFRVIGEVFASFFK